MKKIITIFVILAVLMQLSIVLAEHEHLCEELPTGMAFGQHVVEHAQEGHFSGTMNPGVHHQGYSICVV